MGNSRKFLTLQGLITFKNNILAAVKRIVDKRFVVSETQPSDQEEGGIWFVIK